MYFLVIGGFLAVAFVVSFVRDRRRLRNGAYLVLAVVFLTAGLLLVSTPGGLPTRLALLLVGITVPLLTLVLAVFLIANGVIMISRQGPRAAHLLSLVAGLGMAGFVAMDIVAGFTLWEPLLVLRRSLFGVLAYVSFVFTGFLVYSLAHGRLRRHRDLDFIVVLGSGLPGPGLSPALADRLDLARTEADTGAGPGRRPKFVTSGGYRPDGSVPEARVMADYLRTHGVPADRIVVEDRSRDTEENLVYSKAIMTEANRDYRCLVVTSDYRVLRTAQLARKADLNGQVIGAHTAGYCWPGGTIREFGEIFLEHWVLNIGICVLLFVYGVVM